MAINGINSNLNTEITRPVMRANYDAVQTREGNKEPIEIVELVDGSKVTSEQNNLQSSGQKGGTATEKQIKDAIQQANSKLLKKTTCEFAYHEETKRISIKVIDQETKEVLKEIPPEETLRMVEKMWELAGILIDEKR